MSYKYTYGVRRDIRRRLIVSLVCLTIVFGGVLAAMYGLHHTPKLQPTAMIAMHSPVSTPKINTNFGLPNRLQISKLHIDTHVIYVGLTKDGNMSVPTNVIDAGWYKYGALPGNTGTAVIAGHLDGLRGEPGVFSNLSKLVPGDTILVSESNGVIVSFIVRETKKYPQTEQPTEVFNSTSGSHLNLITCTGNWDSSEHRFAERLVVFADKAA
jgi:LPXTG-site transpeptidase (sortase) family protein